VLRPQLLKHLRPFIELADQAGGDVDGLLASLALSRRDLRNPTTRRPYYQLQWLTEQLIAQCADPEVGLRAAERAQFVRDDVLGHLIRHFIQVSTDLFSVLDLLARFWTNVSKTTTTTLTVEPHTAAPEENVVVIRIVARTEPPPEVYDSVAGASCLLIQALGGASVRPIEVRLPRARPARPERYEQFFGSPVVFEAAQLELVYAQAALRSPASEHALPDELPGLVAATPSLSRLVDQIRTRALATLSEGVPRLPAMARKLGVSARTLRRRLSDVRTSYAELIDEARRERALTLASRAELDVGRLAELTGFADASTFARAFRRWTGAGPREFMQRARDKARPSAARSNTAR
jgi:AraC-like DNA-binding protein